MKRPCALISLTLIFALMLSLSATAHANESISDYDSPKASRENSYRIDFQNDILFNSPTMRSNLSTISESLDTDVAENENRTKLWYKYDQSTLNNLNVDSNEALEMEVVFYNYNKSSTSQNDKGNAFQLIKSGSTWATNQPNSYRDTNFLDNNQEVSFCVGVDDTSDLVAGRWYYWYINGTKGTTANNYPNDGRFKVTAQRGYRLLGSGTWSVFADEHEAIRSLGIPSNLNWVPADENAWTYAAANDDWNFDSSTDPVK